MLIKRNLLRMMLTVRKASSVSFKTLNKVQEPPGKYVLLTIPVVTFGLGTWQVYRRNWKLNLIEELQAKNNTAPVDLLENLNNLEELEYRPVYVRGVFDHSKELYIGPRSLINNAESRSSMFSSPSPSGYFVVTPFKLADKNMTILVNRGWVPKSKLSPNTRQEGQVTNEINLVGIVRLTEKRPVFSAKNSPASKLFLFRDLDAIAAKCGASPVFLDATFDSSVPGGPQGGQTRVTLRNEHLSYIVIWYGISAMTSWLWYKKYIQRVPLI